MNVKGLITLHEKRMKSIYTDTVGKISGGIGRNLTDKGFRDDEIDLMFKNDLDEAWNDCAKYPWFLSLSEARKAACLDLMFNLGATKFAKFQKFIAAMAAKDYETAGNELIDSAWYTQVGLRGPDIVNLIKKEVWPYERSSNQ